MTENETDEPENETIKHELEAEDFVLPSEGDEIVKAEFADDRYAYAEIKMSSGTTKGQTTLLKHSDTWSLSRVKPNDGTSVIVCVYETTDVDASEDGEDE